VCRQRPGADATRPLSQPWLVEAIGTAEWTGTPLRGVLEEAGVQAGAVEAVFTGLDAGIEADKVQRYQRSLTIADALDEGVLLAWAMNGAPLPPQHGGPLRLVVPGWYGMASVKWLARIELVERPFEGHYMVGTYRRSRGRARRAGHAPAGARAHGAARHAGFLHPHAPGAGRTCRDRGARLGRAA
jgi:DMSO/TMAO reductase YedYZ molybdopterin-dependent catalytic subunit